jgi:nitrous oxide reductase accessory protein NosL
MITPLPRPLLALLALAVIPLGCGHAPTLAPPDLHPNQDTCHECGMTVSDVRHAAAVMVLKYGLVEQFVFDDTGEMLAFADPAGATQIRRYAHDFGTGAWIDAAAAYFVKAPDVHTPMATGVIAYAAASDARAAAERYHGQVLNDRPGVPAVPVADAE